MTAELKNTGAEREILGAILTDPAALHKVSPIIKAGDFYRQDYSLLYDLMAGMILQGARPDVVTLTEAARARLKDRQQDILNVYRAITDLGMVGKGYNLEEKARIVAAYSRRRQLVAKARELAAAAAEPGEDVDRIAATFSNDIQGITYQAQKDTGDMGAAIMEFMATLDHRGKGEVLSTGLADLDHIITGFEPGQLVVIAGRPGHGKSALAGTIALNLAKRGREILLFSMEMGKGEVAGRFVSRLANIPGGILKKPGAMTEDQKAALTNGLEKLKALPITINTPGNLTPEEVASIAARQKQTKGVDLIIIDYLQLMGSGRKFDGSRVQEISYITRTLKNLAVSLEAPILLLSQLSRTNDKENRPPRLTDLRDSGSIEQDANTVILLHREREGDGLSAKTLADVAKQRDGGPGACSLYFAASLGYFGNYDSSRDIPY